MRKDSDQPGTGGILRDAVTRHDTLDERHSQQ
jgi:hypothetical protein